MNTDNERAAAAEATLDYVVALSKHGIDMPPPPPRSVFLIRRGGPRPDEAWLVAVLLDYRGVEVATFGHAGTIKQWTELGARLGFPPDRIRVAAS